MTDDPTPPLPRVSLPPINGKVLKVGLISDEYNIGGTRRGKNIVPVYDGTVVDYIAEMAKKRVHHRFDARILITGPVRTGKSTTAVAIARAIDPDFPVDNIAFRLEDYREILASLPSSDAKKGVFPTAILDESGVDLYSKDWQVRLVKEMAKVYQIIGKKNLTMIMCLPHRNLLTRDIREQMHIWVSTRTDLEGERGFAELREAVENIWQLEVFWKPLCGFCFNEVADDFWSEYEARKDRFIDDFIAVKKVDDVALPAKTKRHIQQRNAAIKMAYENGKSLKEIGDLVKLTPQAINQIVNERTAAGSKVP